MPQATVSIIVRDIAVPDGLKQSKTLQSRKQNVDKTEERLAVKDHHSKGVSEKSVSNQVS